MTSFSFFLFFIPVLAFLLLGINFLFAPYNPNAEKRTAFECGFHSFLGQNRSQFTVSFFIFALLFLLFDLEILLIYPYALSSSVNDIYGLIVMLVFFLLLTIGFVFELGKKALTLDSKQRKRKTIAKLKDSYCRFIASSNIANFYITKNNYTLPRNKYLFIVGIRPTRCYILPMGVRCHTTHNKFYDLNKSNVQSTKNTELDVNVDKIYSNFRSKDELMDKLPNEPLTNIKDELNNKIPSEPINSLKDSLMNHLTEKKYL